MIEFRPFDPRHLSGFDPDPHAMISIPELLSEDLDCLNHVGSWTGFAGTDPVVCGGLQPVWPGKSLAWGLFSRRIGPQEFLIADRRVRREIRQARQNGIRRIEATVDPYYPDGKALRWVVSLGFRVEGYMRHWTPDGRDMCLVAITGELT